MLVIFYLLFELYFFCFCFFVSFLGVACVLFLYKSQFFFLFCLPYLLITNTSALLITTPNSVFSSYFLLLGNIAFLVYPIFLICCGFFFCITVFSFSGVTIFLKKIFKLVVFFGFLLINVFTVLINYFFYLLEAFNSSTHYVMRFVFDFSINSWLFFSLAIYFFLFVFIFFVFLLISSVRYALIKDVLFLLRSLFVIFNLFFVTLFVPNEPLLHIVFFIFIFFVLECIVVLTLLREKYCGRVA